MKWKMKAEDKIEEVIDVHVDSDWAGCKETRKSMSGGMLVVHGVVVKFWSRSQKSRAMSSTTRRLEVQQKALDFKLWQRF